MKLFVSLRQEWSFHVFDSNTEGEMSIEMKMTIYEIFELKEGVEGLGSRFNSCLKSGWQRFVI